MWNAPEVVREVGVDDFPVALVQLLIHLDHRLLRVAPRAVGVLFRWEVGFEDRFQHQHCCCHADSITQGRDAQWPEFARSLTTYCVRLELRSLPSPGITRLHRYNEPLRLPRAPGLSLAGIRLVIPDHASGSPVLRTLSLCACCRHYPGAAAGAYQLCSFTQPYQPSPKGLSGPPAHRPFRGLHGVHLRYGLHTRAATVFRDTLSEGFEQR